MVRRRRPANTGFVGRPTRASDRSCENWQAPIGAILISTRLYPADLQMVTGAPVVGCSAYILRGLGDDDALSLWRAFGVGGSPEALLPLFHSCDNYPLLIRALAGEVAGYRREPGDFDRWLRDHPGFEPARLPLVQAKSHILSFALRGMDETTRAVLDTVAAFRMPASYDTLAALLVGPDRRFADEAALDVALTELEDRGLLGWDRRANRYDLHPIVPRYRLGRSGRRRQARPLRRPAAAFRGPARGRRGSCRLH